MKESTHLPLEQYIHKQRPLSSGTEMAIEGREDAKATWNYIDFPRALNLSYFLSECGRTFVSKDVLVKKDKCQCLSCDIISIPSTFLRFFQCWRSPT